MSDSLPTHTARVAWCFGDDFDVDQMIGVSNIKIQDESLLVDCVMKQFENNFLEKITSGDVLVGGGNFGYGHPHAVSMRAMRHVGIKTVIAESFFSSFWIGEISYGMPLIRCPGIAKHVERFDTVKIEFNSNKIIIVNKKIELPFEPYTNRELEVLKAGGLKNLLLKNKTKHN